MSAKLETLLAELDHASQNWDAEKSASVAATLEAHLNQAPVCDPSQFVRSLGQAVRAAAAQHDPAAVKVLTGKLEEFLRKAVPGEAHDFVLALKHSTRTFDKPRTKQLCDELIKQLWNRPAPYPYSEAKTILGRLITLRTV